MPSCGGAANRAKGSGLVPSAWHPPLGPPGAKWIEIVHKTGAGRFGLLRFLLLRLRLAVLPAECAARFREVGWRLCLRLEQIRPPFSAEIGNGIRQGWPIGPFAGAHHSESVFFLSAPNPLHRASLKWLSD